jgi:hypothetical protein
MAYDGGVVRVVAGVRMAGTARGVCVLDGAEEVERTRAGGWGEADGGEHCGGLCKVGMVLLLQGKDIGIG